MGKTGVRRVRQVTLEVNPKIAEKVAVAQTIGTLSLVVRSIADNQVELDRAIASGDLVVPENATPEEEERLLRSAMNQPNDKGTTYSTGGDVSRFQRSSMPAMGAAPPPAMGVPSGATGPVAGPSGPSVRVTRGKNTTEVPVSSSSGRLMNQQAAGIRNGGRTVPAASAEIGRAHV